MDEAAHQHTRPIEHQEFPAVHQVGRLPDGKPFPGIKRSGLHSQYQYLAQGTGAAETNSLNASFLTVTISSFLKLSVQALGFPCTSSASRAIQNLTPFGGRFRRSSGHDWDLPRWLIT